MSRVSEQPPALSRSASLTQAVRRLLTSFVPGYSVFADLLGSRLGVDADKLLAILGFWFAGWAGFSYLKNVLLPRIASSFTSEIELAPSDRSYSDFLAWLRSSNVFTRSKMLYASDWTVGDLRTARRDRYARGRIMIGDDFHGSRNAEEASDPDEAPEDPVEDSMPSSRQELFNLAQSEGRKQLNFTPRDSVYWFFHGYRPFLVKRIKHSNPDWATGFSYSLKLVCLGWSTRPLESVLQEAFDSAVDRRLSHTTMWDGDSRAGGWRRLPPTPRRPLDTISLDADLKRDLVADMNAFLQPERARWYAARGVPYRRGYLFHGPPGCGKTSVAYSLAGTFGLDLYVANLLHGHMSEGQLVRLIAELPKRCLFVIEDIDAIAPNRETEDNDDPWLAPPIRNMSLSQLLNAIDGFHAHEGHILIMTSNYQDRLDPALVRPGRIDRIIDFSTTTQQQIYEMFMRVYGPPKRSKQLPTTVEEVCRPLQPDTSAPGSRFDSEDAIRAAATNFAAQVPERTFTPAKIQEYLMTHMDDPVSATSNVAAWSAEQIQIQKDADAKRAARKKKLERRRARQRAMARYGGPLGATDGDTSDEAGNVEDRPDGKQSGRKGGLFGGAGLPGIPGFAAPSTMGHPGVCGLSAPGAEGFPRMTDVAVPGATSPPEVPGPSGPGAGGLLGMLGVGALGVGRASGISDAAAPSAGELPDISEFEGPGAAVAVESPAISNGAVIDDDADDESIDGSVGASSGDADLMLGPPEQHARFTLDQMQMELGLLEEQNNRRLAEAANRGY